MLSGWQAVLAGALVVFGVLRLLLQRWKIQIGWMQLRPLTQAGLLACLLLGLVLLTWPGLSPTFIYFKF
jgi:hypothetical protein